MSKQLFERLYSISDVKTVILPTFFPLQTSKQSFLRLNWTWDVKTVILTSLLRFRRPNSHLDVSTELNTSTLHLRPPNRLSNVFTPLQTSKQSFGRLIWILDVQTDIWTSLLHFIWTSLPNLRRPNSYLNVFTHFRSPNSHLDVLTELETSKQSFKRL